MELGERLLADISNIFKKVEYSRITFYLSPEKLNYSVETSGILDITKKNKRILLTKPKITA